MFVCVLTCGVNGNERVCMRAKQDYVPPGGKKKMERGSERGGWKLGFL